MRYRRAWARATGASAAPTSEDKTTRRFIDHLVKRGSERTVVTTLAWRPYGTVFRSARRLATAGPLMFSSRSRTGQAQSNEGIVAKVLAAERVPKSKRLLKLQVDVGTEVRTLVAGIAEAYEPETLIGRTVAIVFNLQPATLMGVESNGMVLAASPDGGKPMLVSFETPPPPGTRIR